ncbi:MAG TPA: DUF3617 domain-containing protein [Allosphingosinicella sp.]
MNKPMILTAALLVLAGCGGSETKKDGGNASAIASAEPAPAAKGDGPRLDPGEWEMTMEMSMEGVPAAAAEMMKGMKVTTRNCITPEEAERPKADVFAGKKEGECTYEDYSFNGGRLRSTISCEGGKTKIRMDGRYGGSSIDMTMDTQSSGQSMKARMTGKRVGECSAATKEG